MFAIIKTGGKQYKVAANEILKIEKIDIPAGGVVEFSDVLLIGEGSAIKVGTPALAKAKVFGTVVDQIRDDKVLIFKKKRRHNYRRKNGHRQYLSVVKITEILPEGGTPKIKAEPVKEKAAPAKAPAKETTPKAAAPKKDSAASPKAPVKKAAPKAQKAPKK